MQNQKDLDFEQVVALIDAEAKQQDTEAQQQSDLSKNTVRDRKTNSLKPSLHVNKYLMQDEERKLKNQQKQKVPISF